ncbi:MAG TPA: helix-turn-helix transcriptional regulator [Mucilaginibacter sp.]|jgi:transcriptional regulator with XRE-family HTH domain
MEPGNQPIPNRLKMHRKMMGYKQKEVAKLLGLYSTSPLSEWENGANMPSSRYLIKLSILYRTYVNELYPEYFQEVRESLHSKEFEVFHRE